MTSQYNITPPPFRLSAVCSENPGLSGRYHAGFWSGKRWSCCRMSTRSAEGCDTCSSWSTSSKPSAGAPSINSSANSATVDRQQQQQQQQSTNATTGTTTTTTTEANNNPIVQSQTRSNNGECAVALLIVHIVEILGVIEWSRTFYK